MKQLYYVIQTLRHAAGSNLFKVVSLGLALAMSVLLFARVAYEQSYDTCFRDYDDICQVWMRYIMNGEKLDWQEQNMGPTVGTILEHFPDQVEAGTCTQFFLASAPLYHGNVRFNEPKICADSLFFRTMGIEVLSGNPVQDLQQPHVIYLSESFAKRLFGNANPIGQTLDYNHERSLTVRGTYADIPDNTTVKADAIISMPPSWVKTQLNYSWDGGDSYPQYVRLKPGTDVDKLNARIDALISQLMPDRGKDGADLSIRVAPLRDTYRGYDEVARMKVIMLVLGLSILFIAALNYALLSVSSLSRRAKAVGVHKCSGASGGGVFGMFLLETAVIVLLAVVVMAGLMLGFRDFVEDTAATKLGNLFTWERIWVPVLTVLLLFVVGGVLPGQLFARIPVTQVFRRYTEGRKGWKRPLLFVQFGGVAFICGLMGMIMLQYRYVMNKDMGYVVDRMAVSPFGGLSDVDSDRAVAFFKSLPYVEAVAGSILRQAGLRDGQLSHADGHDAAQRPRASRRAGRSDGQRGVRPTHGLDGGQRHRAGGAHHGRDTQGGGCGERLPDTELLPAPDALPLLRDEVPQCLSHLQAEGAFRRQPAEAAKGRGRSLARQDGRHPFHAADT